MSRQLLLVINLCGLFFIQSAAQSYRYVYYLDNNLQSTSENKAVFIAKGVPDSGLVKVDYFLKGGHNAVMSIQFKDSTLAVMNGIYKSFYLNGKLDNIGLYENGLEEGTWIKWDSTGHITDSAIYKNGVRNIHATYLYDPKGKLYSREFLDSINDVYRYTVYDGNRISTDAEFSGKKAVLNMYDSNGVVTTKPVYSRERHEASFPGGDQAYRKYLTQNLRPEVPINNGAPAGFYTVIVRFVVQTDGNISDIIPETHLGYGMEDEVVRIINKSPRWIPGNLFGEKIKSHRRQPVTFFVEQR